MLFFRRIHFLRELREFFQVKFKIEPCRNQDMDINHKRLLEEKEEAENLRKKKRKRNLQLPQEIEQDELNNKDDVDREKEEEKKKVKQELEEKDKSVKDYLRLGHEKLLMSCVGIGFSNITKTFVWIETFQIRFYILHI